MGIKLSPVKEEGYVDVKLTQSIEDSKPLLSLLVEVVLDEEISNQMVDGIRIKEEIPSSDIDQVKADECFMDENIDSVDLPKLKEGETSDPAMDFDLIANQYF